ncbi:hypothetical protein K456DRAFT_1131989 [Colletotrichum gloeosporioides 23]|nr:hypothetical protein K456DRAFT_1131989 [Colletotrichum gloeosporioides 23]
MLPSSAPRSAVRSCQVPSQPPSRPGQFYAPNSRQTPIFTIPPANVVRPLSGRPLFWTHEKGFMASMAAILLFCSHAVLFHIFTTPVSSRPRFFASLSPRQAVMLLKVRPNIRLLDLILTLLFLSLPSNLTTSHNISFSVSFPFSFFPSKSSSSSSS